MIFIVGLFFIFYVNAEEYVIRYRKPFCFTCQDGGEITFKQFAAKEDVEQWLDLHHNIKPSVFLLKPVSTERLITDEIRIVDKVIQESEHVYKWKIKEEL
jgi:hypothetical protein